ncbi:hypothetical protein BGZ57DRAFT_938925 [Hyaloscypha finlandica]|nr:hypothetical protein BGZ57DRAFT_938925 [Hyaloscypha finlandica]
MNDLYFNGKYVGWPLERVCNVTKHQPGLVFMCENNSGGICNIRNFILTCVRYAFDAGATGIILPKIQRRSVADLANIFTTLLQPIDYLFDEQHFHIPNPQNKMTTKEFYPKDLNNPDGGDTRGKNRHLDMYRTKFDGWLSGTHRAPRVEKSVAVRFKWAAFFEWPAYSDGPEFAATFGDILRIRKDIADLAAMALMEMSKFTGFDPSPEELHSENNALKFWPDFHSQTNGYLEGANNTNLKHAYLACGNATECHRFAEQAWSQLHLSVTSKLDLLKGDDLKRLQVLSWDQQALVDFLRHLMTGGIMTRQWPSLGDVYSTLVGRVGMWWGDWTFMYECMWP